MSTANVTAKDRVRDVLDQLPDDATLTEIVRAIAFSKMVETGLAQAEAGQLVEDQEVLKLVEAWEASAGLQKPLNG
jgi:predicted transcriptional regulator